MKSSVADSLATRKRATDVGAFSDRLIDALERRPMAALAREIGVSPSAFQRYLNGTIPASDIGLRLARALGVNPSWLIEGRGAKETDAAGAQTTRLQRRDIYRLAEHGRDAVVGEVDLPTEWVMSAARTTKGLWLTEMPNNAMSSVAAEGESLICRDPEQPLQDKRVYIFLVNGRPIVRRLAVRPTGLELRADDEADTIVLEGEDTHEAIPVARVLAAVNLRQL